MLTLISVRKSPVWCLCERKKGVPAVRLQLRKLGPSNPVGSYVHRGQYNKRGEFASRNLTDQNCFFRHRRKCSFFFNFEGQTVANLYLQTGQVQVCQQGSHSRVLDFAIKLIKKEPLGRGFARN